MVKKREASVREVLTLMGSPPGTLMGSSPGHWWGHPRDTDGVTPWTLMGSPPGHWPCCNERAGTGRKEMLSRSVLCLLSPKINRLQLVTQPRSVLESTREVRAPVILRGCPPELPPRVTSRPAWGRVPGLRLGEPRI